MKAIVTGTILLSTLSISLSAQAGETELTSQSIENLLKGQSISGVHYQQKTVQYFSESGLTLWMKAGDKAPSEGKWKVENNQYCSDFGSGWGCYKVVNDEAQGIHYFIAKNFRAPFIAQKGFNLSL